MRERNLSGWSDDDGDDMTHKLDFRGGYMADEREREEENGKKGGRINRQ